MQRYIIQISDDPWTMGTAICVSETARLEALANATREALQAVDVPMGCAELRRLVYDYDQRSGSSHIGYYDLADIMQEMLDDEAYVAWRQVFDEAVTYYTTDTNYSSAAGNFSMEGTHGVTHYLPSSADVEACEPYHTLEWYDAAGIAAMGW